MVTEGRIWVRALVRSEPAYLSNAALVSCFAEDELNAVQKEISDKNPFQMIPEICSSDHFQVVVELVRSGLSLKWSM